MICIKCGCFFCDDDADNTILGKTPSKRCSVCSTTGKGGDRTAQRRRATRRKHDHARRKNHYTEAQAQLIVFKMKKEQYFGSNPGYYKCCERGFMVTRNVIDSIKDNPDDLPEAESWTAKGSQALSNPVIPPEVAEFLRSVIPDDSSEPSQPPGQS